MATATTAKALSFADERAIRDHYQRMLDSWERASYPDVPWRDIIGLRIVLAHHHHGVDPNQVWAIAAEEVPRLAEHLRP